MLELISAPAVDAVPDRGNQSARGVDLAAVAIARAVGGEVRLRRRLILRSGEGAAGGKRERVAGRDRVGDETEAHGESVPRGQRVAVVALLDAGGLRRRAVAGDDGGEVDGQRPHEAAHL